MSKYCADMNEVNRVKIWKNPRESLLMFNPTDNKNDNSLYKSIVLKTRFTSVDGLGMINEDQDLEGIEITPDIKSVIEAWIADVEGTGERKSEYKTDRSLINSQTPLNQSSLGKDKVTDSKNAIRIQSLESSSPITARADSQQLLTSED
jgi:hypothetical protein